MTLCIQKLLLCTKIDIVSNFILCMSKYRFVPVEQEALLKFMLTFQDPEIKMIEYVCHLCIFSALIKQNSVITFRTQPYGDFSSP